MFSEDKREAKKEYLNFIDKEMERTERSHKVKSIDQRFYDNQKFVERVKKRLIENESPYQEPNRDFSIPNPEKRSLEEILKIVSKATKVFCGSLLSKSRVAEICVSRSLFAYIASRHFGIGNKEISAFLSRDSATVTYILKKVSQRVHEDNELARQLKKVIKVFKV